MALRATLYRFRIELSDIERGLYAPLDFRAAMHPSETPRYLVTRALAYALSFEEGIEFTPGGISDTDEPALRVMSLDGLVRSWIEIGTPSIRKLHRGSKSAKRVAIFSHKDPTPLLKDIADGAVHRASEIEVYSFSNGFIDELEAVLEKDNDWNLVRNEGSLTINLKSGRVIEGEIHLSRIV